MVGSVESSTARELSDLDEALTRELAALQAFLDAWPADAR